MNKRGHVLNALLLALGLGFVIEPGLDMATARTVAEITVPIVLGALSPTSTPPSVATGRRSTASQSSGSSSRTRSCSGTSSTSGSAC